MGSQRTGEESVPVKYEPAQSSVLMVRPKVLDLFFRFVDERQTVFYRRFIERRPPPWTRDRILRRYKFTNVYRELDRGTLYLLKEIVGRGSSRDVLFNILIYRIFNRIETYQAIGFQNVDSFDSDAMLRRLQSLRQRGIAVFTNAFMVPGTKYANSPRKVENIVIGVIRDDLVRNFDAHYDRIIGSPSLEAAHSAVKGIRHFGDFLAYEAIIDLNYSGLLNISEDDWVTAGPGCRKGIDYIFASRGGLSYAEVVRVLREDQEFHFGRLGITFHRYDGKDLTLRNIEHSLCEFSKYYRLYTGKRTHARKFLPSPIPLPLV